MWPLLITNAVVLICFLVVTIFMTKYISHKVGGPIWKMGRTIEDIGRGNLQAQIHLRRQDQLKDFATQVNEMTSNLKEKVLNVQGQVAALRLKVQAPESREEEIREDTERLFQTVFQLFKTSNG
jgi:methyl-accepting chemotaxis protein